MVISGEGVGKEKARQLVSGLSYYTQEKGSSRTSNPWVIYSPFIFLDFLITELASRRNKRIHWKTEKNPKTGAKLQERASIK